MPLGTWELGSLVYCNFFGFHPPLTARESIQGSCLFCAKVVRFHPPCLQGLQSMASIA